MSNIDIILLIVSGASIAMSVGAIILSTLAQRRYDAARKALSQERYGLGRSARPDLFGKDDHG